MAAPSVQQMIKFNDQIPTTNDQFECTDQYNLLLDSLQSIILQHKGILLDIFTLIFIIILLIAIAPSSEHETYPFLDWMNPYKLKEFRESFYHLLDHNNDGIVNITELCIGIQAQLDLSYIYNNHSLISFIPDKYSCIPSLDFCDFADFSVLKARAGLISTNIISFDELLNSYFGECNDIIPPQKQFENMFCEELISQNPYLCKQYPSYCKLSCYQCDENINYFIRGMDNTFIERPEKLPADYNYKAVTDNNSDMKNNIVFVSDIHIEPWYDVAFNGKGRIGRFNGANMNNMFECRNDKNVEVNCTLNGKTDAPFPLYSSGLEFFNNLLNLSTNKNENILIFSGDTQPHKFTKDILAPLNNTMNYLLSNVINEMLKYFDPKNIFYAVGNNDGQHNEIFCVGSSIQINNIWSNILIKNGIVSNDLNRKYFINNQTYNQVELFEQTGYYIKQIPKYILNNINNNKEYYVIVLNTNLGISNFRQNNIFINDLKWIKNVRNGYCLIIGHHPTILQSIIPSEFDSIIKGAFSGHVHYFQPSNSKYFAILPSITQYAKYVGIVNGQINNNGNVILTWNNLNQYIGKEYSIPQQYYWHPI